MKQSLQLRLGQHLAMTPQLQQAIRLLQLSTLELHTEIQEALDSNLMLEVEEEFDGAAGPDEARAESDVEPADIPGELPVDSDWDDIYDAPAGHQPSSGNGEGNGSDLEIVRAGTESLKDHLYSQMSMQRLSDIDRAIGSAIIDSVDDDGYLAISLDEIHESLLTQNVDVELDEVEAVLRQIHNFDPAGVASRGLGECLRIQLEQQPPDRPWRDEAINLVSNHLEVLAAKDYQHLMRSLKLETEELQAVIDLIQSLHPRPGTLIESSAPEYVIPDVFVRKEKDKWKVELNPDAFPRVRVNSEYAGLVRRADNSADNTTLKTHLQEARWFIKSLRSRSETLLKVATCIVERQRGFLEFGDEAMKPMVLADVAEVVEMHESTISRVTTQKYMHTPRGIYELKYFFSSHVYTKSGAECSSTAIRALLKKLIAAENPKKPLSDSKLAQILSDQGIKVARRTVAKYREGMSIPSSPERKSLM